MGRAPVVLFALLAHENPESVAEQVSALHRTSPGCRVVAFNGGDDERLFDSADVEVCSYRWPIRWGWGLERYELGVMLHARDHDVDYDFLVVIDSDMIPIRPGFGDWLEQWLGEASYAAAFLRMEPPRTGHFWTRRLFLQRSAWRDVIGPGPYAAVFNPCQVFRRELVDAILDSPRVQRLAGELGRSQLNCLEEVLWPNLVAALGRSSARLPARQEAALHGEHTVDDVERFADDPVVYFVHKMPLDVGDPVRVALGRARRELLERGGAPKAFGPPLVGPGLGRGVDPIRQSMRVTPRVRLVEVFYAAQAAWWRLGPRPRLDDPRLLFTEEARRRARQSLRPRRGRRG